MIDVEMLLILIVFWIYFILELKRVFVKVFLSFVWGVDGDWEKRVVFVMC